ncbi:cell envelope integrity protein TolA [Leeia oryzae]|uniref:cell envelope integrity protein TolA n=1 Tax=Leeia oryzae TaxID=356662 RepID=UPI0003651377|nr:cell envelope integrity protein TolA [Leeia oryzae]
MNRFRENGLNPASVALALLAHVLLLVLLYFGASWTTTPPKPVEAQLWAGIPGETQDKPVKPPKQMVSKPVEKTAPPPVEPKPKVKVETPKEAPKVVTNDKARIKVEAPASKTKAAKPQKTVEAEKPVVKPQKPDSKPLKTDNSKAIRDEMAKQLAAEAADRAKEQAAMKAAADAEARKLAEGRAKQGRDMADYQQKVAALVRQRVNFDDPGGPNLDAKFIVSFLPNYEILDVQLLKSSGNPAYDQAVERALHALKRLPPPPDGVTLGRESQFSFRLRE